MKDYHDLWIANLERIAEEEYNKASMSAQAGEAGALERVQQWFKTLSGIRQIKNTDAKGKAPQMEPTSQKHRLVSDHMPGVHQSGAVNLGRVK